MKTVITLKDNTRIETPCNEVVPIVSRVKITSKHSTKAMQELCKVENKIFDRLDRQGIKAQRGTNQRELRRSKRG